jgi:DNA-binding response OmpR family regulator
MLVAFDRHARTASLCAAEKEHTSMLSRVLLVDDSTPFRRMVGSFLKRCRFEVHEASSQASARQMLPTVKPEILLLDLELEDGESFDFLREAAGQGVPTIVLSARSGVHDRVTAFQLGAEDFMVKPLSLLELRLRMRRLAGISAIDRPENIIDFGAFVLDLQRRCVRHGWEHIVELSEAELLLARLFISAGDKVLTRETIAREALGRRFGEHSRAVDMLVSKLRRKLDPTRQASMIWAVRGEGYRFAGRPALQGRLAEDL